MRQLNFILYLREICVLTVKFLYELLSPTYTCGFSLRPLYNNISLVDTITCTGINERINDEKKNQKLVSFQQC